MPHEHPRWRFRIGTLMLWVVILALGLNLVLDRWKREQDRRRLTEAVRAAEEANLMFQRAAAQSQARSPSQGPR
jgi:hypothetical protein